MQRYPCLKLSPAGGPNANISPIGETRTYTPNGRRIGDAGWEFAYIAIDDCTRLAYVEVLSDEKTTAAVDFLPARSRSSSATASRSSG